MTAEEMDEYRNRLVALRRQAGNAERNDIERLVLQIGYTLRPKKGGHPVYVKPGCLPITIPGHRNRLNRNTVKGILDRVEEELDRLEEGLKRGN